MKFEPIIHNLTVHDQGFIEAQHYNFMDKKRPVYVGWPLDEKIRLLREWDTGTRRALDAVRKIFNQQD